MFKRIQFAGLMLALGLLAACSTQQDRALAPEEVDAQALDAFFQAQFDAGLARAPEFKTYLGLLDDLDAYGRWNDVSDDARVADIERTRNTLAELRTRFANATLPERARVSYKFAEFVAENSLQQAAFDDQHYVFTQFFGPHTDMSTLLIGYHKVETVAHAEAYLRRLQSYGDVLNIHIDSAEQRAAAGVLPPAFAYPVIIETSQGLISGAPFGAGEGDSPLWADFAAKVDDLNVEASVKADLKARAKQALLNSVKPAYDRLIGVMTAQAAQAGPDDGVWKLPRGEAYYQAQLANYTTRDDLTADQIHQLGLDEVERIHEEMRAIMARVKFEGNLQAFFTHLRESDEFYYTNDEAGRQRYLREATAFIDQMMALAPEYFGTLPKAALEVRAVEPYRIETATGAFYEPGSLDGSRPGAYYVNLSDMRELPVYQMETLAYHEGAPGHHFQGSIAQELRDVPMFQKLTWYSAYGEGWALYAEKMGKDMGAFTDPYQDFGRLSYEVFRAARLVVDTGVHAKRWTEQQAQQYMLANTPMTRGDIENEVRRYIVWPGQAVSYKVGMLTILELRQKAKDALGDKFDYRAFHDAVLTNGSLPLSLLAEQVDAYIAKVLAD
ncbi:DUF885 domain-containing protein [Simiduia aestuariiviva]|uniref:Uncharacterized protein (DUF885 family) n=1 Tax=Simiduia aestuariiviva TaxID=1510459 RepID=A0A839ULZ1_9GAMM|nr:DUF885 domain-containing protein [Simiduia aestuariiviva]MBB3168872.1 uncharacterized protein (DUF885 family) [Simiduia aestuariiviva]